MIAALTAFSAAQGQQDQPKKTSHHRYKLIDLGTLGGPSDVLQTEPITQMLNEAGIVVFASETNAPDPFAPDCFEGPGCLQLHAVESNGSKLIRLPEVRGGVNSFAAQVNQFGVAVGASQDGTLDTTTNFPRQVPVIWVDHVPVDLGGLGGMQGVGNGVNDFGLATGVALTKTLDPFANDFSQAFLLAPGTTSAHAFLWNGSMHDLGTLGGPDSMAWFVNDLGQVAGNSYTGSTVTNFWFNPDTGNPTMAPFLWDRGQLINLGSLGGHMGQVVALNNLGQVTGFSTLSDDSTIHPFFWSQGTLTDLGTLGGPFAFPLWMNPVGNVVGFSSTTADFGGHAFLWLRGKMIDLGVLGDDPCSVPLGINLRNQIVGASTDCFEGETAVLWENGQPPIDLNTLVPEGSPLFLHEADSVNDRGEIVGIGLTPEGNTHVFELIPKDSLSGDDNVPRISKRPKIASQAHPRMSAYPNKQNPWDFVRGIHSKAAHRGEPVRKCETPCPEAPNR